MANTSFDSQPGQDDNVNLANNIWRLIGAQEGENDPGNQRSGGSQGQKGSCVTVAGGAESWKKQHLKLRSTVKVGWG